jgi:hypothetical protein
MSRRVIIEIDPVQRIDISAEKSLKILKNLISENTQSLDELMDEIQESIYANNISDQMLERYILELANSLYFVGARQELLGIKEDVCKMIRQQVYSEGRSKAEGTVADKDAIGIKASEVESQVLAIYSRAYKTIKIKVESGYEMLNSLKKVMNHRISEMELSNSRFLERNDNGRT